MTRKSIRITILTVILAALPYPLWNASNWYAAGLVDQHQLIEFGMEEDFLYCNKWRPELLKEEAIDGLDYEYKRYPKDIISFGEIRGNEPIQNYSTIGKIESNKAAFDQINWSIKYGYDKILKRLLKLGHRPNHDALYHAIKHDKQECIKLLLQRLTVV